MGQAEKIHPVPRRDSIDYYREIACPDCGSVVFVLSGDDNPTAYDDLETFVRHNCRGASPAGKEKPPGLKGGYPVNLERISVETARGFRAAIEAAFGKKLFRFSGVFRRKGLPIHFTPEWKPSLGYVSQFSGSDVHRELDANLTVFKLALPHLVRHFEGEAGTSLRKYFFSSKGVAKHERTRVLRVILWTWPRRGT
jgi:hypothetical protein